MIALARPPLVRVMAVLAVGAPGGTGGFTGWPVSVVGSYLPLIGNVDGAAGAYIIWLRDTASAPVWWSYLGP